MRSPASVLLDARAKRPLPKALTNPLLHFCEGDCIARFYANQEFPKSEMIKFEN
jgi:hypothetical protein